MNKNNIKLSITSRLLHFKQPAGTSRGVYTTRKSFYVSISDLLHPERKGTGECAALPDLSCDALPDDEYEQLLRRFCDDVELTGKIDLEAMRPYPSMLFGLETAMAQYEAGGSSISSLPRSDGARRASPSTDWYGWEVSRKCTTGWRRNYSQASDA